MSTAAGKKIAIVTGSALGLGYELARQLIGKGWFVAGIDFNTARQEELSRTFGADEYRAFVGDEMPFHLQQGQRQPRQRRIVQRRAGQHR